MEDSEKTIEFLRARLLSERSVSSTARQRADELAERVCLAFAILSDLRYLPVSCLSN